MAHVLIRETGTLRPATDHLGVRHGVLAPTNAHGPADHGPEGVAWVTLEEPFEREPEPGYLRVVRAGLALLARLDPVRVPGAPAP